MPHRMRNTDLEQKGKQELAIPAQVKQRLQFIHTSLFPFPSLIHFPDHRLKSHAVNKLDQMDATIIQFPTILYLYDVTFSKGILLTDFPALANCASGNICCILELGASHRGLLDIRQCWFPYFRVCV